MFESFTRCQNKEKPSVRWIGGFPFVYAALSHFLPSNILDVFATF
jgi:hypothetical protein